MPAPSANTEPTGASGIIVHQSGTYQDRDRNTKFRGQQKRYGSQTQYGEWEAMLATDSTINTAYDAVSDLILSATHEIVEPEGTSEEVADFLRRALFEWPSRDYWSFAREALRFPGWGFYTFENVVRPDEYEGKRVIALDDFQARLPWTIDRWDVEGGRLVRLWQWAHKDGSFKHIPLDANLITHFVYDQVGDDFRGTPMFRQLHPHWFRKQELWRHSAIGHHRNNVGTPMAIYRGPPEAYSKDDEDQVVDFLGRVAVHEESKLFLPPNWEVSWFINDKWAEQAGAIRDEVMQINVDIYQAFSAGFLAVGLQSQTGSLASTMTQERLLFKRAQRWARAYEVALNGVGRAEHTGILRWLVDQNFRDFAASGDPYPYIQVSGIETRSVSEFFQGMEAFARSKSMLPSALEELALEKLGAKMEEEEEPEEAEAPPVQDEPPIEVRTDSGPGSAAESQAATGETISEVSLNGAQVTAMVTVIQEVAAGMMPRDTAVRLLSAAFPLSEADVDRIMGDVGRGFKPEPAGAPEGGDVQPDGDTSEDGGNRPEVDAEGRSMSLAAFARDSFTPPRPLLPTEEHVEFAEINGRLDSGVAMYTAIVRKLIGRHVDEIAEAGAENPRLLRDAVASLGDDLEDELGTLAQDLADQGFDQVRREVRGQPGRRDRVVERAKAAQRTTARARTETLEVQAALDELPGDADADSPEAVESEAESVERLRRAVRASAADVEAAVSRSAAEAATLPGDEDAVARRIRAALLNLSEPAIRQAGFGLTATAFAAGREQFAATFGSEIGEVQFSAVLDGNTCGPCFVADGSTFEFGSPEHERHKVPFAECEGGSRCRCQLVYLFREEVEP